MWRAALLLALLLGAGCARQPAAQQTAPVPVDPFADGKVIFQTGRDREGVQIVARSTPLYSRCAACHRADGSGGMHLPGGAVSADLRYKALVTDQRHPYNLRLLERAISTGIDNDGQPLDEVMPRWKLSQRDLHDVAQYVLVKLK